MSQLPPPPFQTLPPKPAVASDDWRPKAIAIMTTVGGGIATLVALVNFFLALGFCITIFTGIYSVVVGVLCLIKGISMLAKPVNTQTPPYPTAILQIINILACDPINMTLGIVILVLLNDPEVKSKFRTTMMAPPGQYR